MQETSGGFHSLQSITAQPFPLLLSKAKLNGLAKKNRHSSKVWNHFCEKSFPIEKSDGVLPASLPCLPVSGYLTFLHQCCVPKNYHWTIFPVSHIIRFTPNCPLSNLSSPKLRQWNSGKSMYLKSQTLLVFVPVINLLPQFYLFEESVLVLLIFPNCFPLLNWFLLKFYSALGLFFYLIS